MTVSATIRVMSPKEIAARARHYLKLLHSDRDPLVESVAGDLAIVTLDFLVLEAGTQRHGVYPMLLFGAPESPSDRGGP